MEPNIRDAAIREIYLTKQEMARQSMTSSEYGTAVSNFINAVLAGAELHRNWNPIGETIDGMIDYTEDDEIPAGTGQFMNVTREELDGFEEVIEEILYLATVRLDLLDLTMDDFGSAEMMLDRVEDLVTYSTEWNSDRGTLAGM